MPEGDQPWYARFFCGAGNVYIADQDATEVLLAVPSANGYRQSALFTGLGNVEAVAVDGSGNVYIASNAYGVLKETLSAGSYIQSTIASSMNAPNSPQSIMVGGVEISPLPAAAAPTASPEAGTYTSAQTVTLTDAISGATIYYTTDGTIPTTGSTQYSGTVTVSSSETIQAIAAASGYANSSVFSATYTINLPVPDFSVAITPTSLNVTSGQIATATVSITPANGFSSPVTFTCSGLPSGTSCSFSPANVTPAGGAASTTVTIVTTTTASAIWGDFGMFPALAAAFCCFGLRKRERKWVLLVLSLCGVGLLGGCGGGPSSVKPTTSMVTMTATAGSVQHSATRSRRRKRRRPYTPSLRFPEIFSLWSRLRPQNERSTQE